MPIEVIKAPNQKVVNKVWGSEQWIVNNQRYCGKFLYLNPGFQCSKHYHTIKAETFYVLQGKVRFELADEVMILGPNDSVEILPFTSHRFAAIDDVATIIEFSSPHRDEDTTRLEDSGPTN